MMSASAFNLHTIDAKEIAPAVAAAGAQRRAEATTPEESVPMHDTARAPLLPHRVPGKLRDLRGWLIWKYEHVEGEAKRRKVPHYAEGGRRNGAQGRPEDRRQLTTFDAACAAASRRGFDGVGLAMLPDWGLTALDFDNCVDAAGHVHPDVERLVAGTYAEFSPSGRGVRAFTLGVLGDRKSHADRERFGLETFHSTGFVTVTGNALDLCELLGTLDVVGVISPELRRLYAERFGDSEPSGSDVAGQGDIDRMVTLAAVTDEVMDDLRSAMRAFTVTDADSYHFWAERMGLALKSVAQAGRDEEARAIWHEFSRLSAKYDAEQCERKWKTFDPDRITYRSIFEWATARGWVNPKSAEALKANVTAATRLDRTDAGNVALLATLTGGDLRFVPEQRTWLWWSGARWERDRYGTHCVAAALQVAEHYHRKADEIRKQAKAATLDDKEAKNIERVAASVEAWATRCRNKSTIDNMLGLAKSDARFTLPADCLDRDPWLFGVENGVVDLRNGELRPAARDDWVTKRSPVRFEPTAMAPRWRSFIDEITAEPSIGADGPTRARPDLAAYMQRALGYSMTGSTAEHKMFIAIGAGANGKNVLLDMLQWIMGDYCETIAPEALMASRHDSDAERATPIARKLAGARVAITSESKDGQRLDVALVKRHTGGGYMTARGLHESPFTFEITHKLWLMTNHKPALDHMDDAMRGRLHMIPFAMRWNRPGHTERDERLPDGDKRLPETLRAEAEGVLLWLVEGAVAYVTGDLTPPIEVERMTRAYFNDQDPLGIWLVGCERCDPQQGTKASDLRHAFATWCMDEGFNDASCISQKAFSTMLKARGIEAKKTSSGNLYGLRTAATGTDDLV